MANINDFVIDIPRIPLIYLYKLYQNLARGIKRKKKKRSINNLRPIKNFFIFAKLKTAAFCDRFLFNTILSLTWHASNNQYKYAECQKEQRIHPHT